MYFNYFSFFAWFIIDVMHIKHSFGILFEFSILALCIIISICFSVFSQQQIHGLELHPHQLTHGMRALVLQPVQLVRQALRAGFREHNPHLWLLDRLLKAGFKMVLHQQKQTETQMHLRLIRGCQNRKHHQLIHG